MSRNEIAMTALGSSALSDNFAGLPAQAGPRAAFGPGHAVELTIVVPTYNERDNVEALLARIDTALAGIVWEIVYVDDDSPDGTAAAVRRIAQCDPRVRCL